MAEKTEFLQAIDDAILDADSLERFINGDDTQDVLTRLSAQYPTIKKALKELFENGGIADRFKTLADLQASSLADGAYALVADDTDDKNGIYIKEGGQWVKSKYDPSTSSVRKAVNKVQNIIEQNIYTDRQYLLDAAIDELDFVYRYTDKQGGLYLVNIANGKSVQDNINELNKKTDATRDDEVLIVNTDALDNVISYYDKDANLVLKNDLKVNGLGVLEGAERANKWAANRTAMVNSLPKLNDKMTIFGSFEEDEKLHKRMPVGIKTKTGALSFFHRQSSKAFSGDDTGSELWKAIISINKEYKPTLVSRELFEAPEVPRGIVKHPMLGRLKDDRIMLVYETIHDGDPSAHYDRWVCYSSDEGVTFTDPVPWEVQGVKPVPEHDKTFLGITGTIVRTPTDRLIMPMHSAYGDCFCAYSDDDGETWFYSDRVQPRFRAWEPSVTVDFDGNLLMDMRPRSDIDFGERDQDPHRQRAKSFDNGRTWQLWTDKMQKITSPSNQGTVYADYDTGILFQTHSNTKGGRTNFTVGLSFDNGKTFDFKYQPYGSTGFTGYSHWVKYDKGVYLLFLEHAPGGYGSNQQESVYMSVITLSEVMSNVSSY